MAPSIRQCLRSASARDQVFHGVIVEFRRWIAIEAAVIERDLLETLEWLRSYDLDADVGEAAARFALAEVSHSDPLISTKAPAADPLGLSQHFV
ncbi:MAG: hypothetical protein WBA45_05715 [Microthrixaceae bacterium]